MSRCAFTIVHDGSHFFDIWCDYYRKFYDDKDIYILDTGKGVATSNLPFNIIPVDYPIWDVPHLSGEVNSFKSELLKSYEWVLYADNDELVYYPDGLARFFELHNKVRYQTCRGYEITQHLISEPQSANIPLINPVFPCPVFPCKDAEQPIDWSKPILSQRKYWKANPKYNKTLVTRDDFKWAIGQHTINKPPKPNIDLLLIHLRKVDYAYCRQLNNKYQNQASARFNNRPIGDDFYKWWVTTSQKLVTIPDKVLRSKAF